MNDQLDDITLPHANKHTGDVNDVHAKLYCKNNCPYCNDETICIKPQYISRDDEDIEWANIYKNFKCLICDNEFWEFWTCCEDDYYFDDDVWEYFNEIDDYTDLYYEDRHDAYCKSFNEAIRTGDLLLIDATYEYTMVELPCDIELYYDAEMNSENQYPIYRRLTPEIVDIFNVVQQGPLEDRFEILDIPDDV